MLQARVQGLEDRWIGGRLGREFNWCDQLKRGSARRQENVVVLASASMPPKQSKEWVLSIDVGTGGTKAALVSHNGSVLASAFAPHRPPSPVRGIVASLEQNPEDWWSAVKLAVCSCIKNPVAVSQGVDAAQLGCVALTGQMQNVILLPQVGDPTQKSAILYSDARAEMEAIEIAGLAGGADRLSSIAGFPQGPSSVLAKLRWLDKHDPPSVQRCQSMLLGGHDFIVWKLCGQRVTDVTTASTTGLTNRTFQYAEDMLTNVGLGPWIQTLPLLHPSDVPCGEVGEKAAAEIGLPLKGLPVLHVCGDAGATSLGAGGGVEGSLYAYLGTSGWVAGSFVPEASKGTTHGHIPAGVFTLGHPEPSLVFRTGSILNAGNNLQWAASSFGSSSGQAGWSEVNKLAALAPAGSGGLLYLPFLNGERCPFDDPHVRACFLGISATTMPSHLLRAVMEGVAYAMRSGRDAMMGRRSITGAFPLVHRSLQVVAIVNTLLKRTQADLRWWQTGPLRLVGGGARSPLWPAIMAGVFGQTVEVLEDAQDVGVKGAAMLAAKWLGWRSVDSSDGDWIRVERLFPPEDQDLYQELFAAYEEVTNPVRKVFKRLSRIKGLHPDHLL